MGKVGDRGDPVQPAYTGYQVWAKQRREEVFLDLEDVSAGHETVMRWNGEEQWVWWAEAVHEALASMEGPRLSGRICFEDGSRAACAAGNSRAAGITVSRTTAVRMAPSTPAPPR